MKLELISILICLTSQFADGQGIFIYDQQTTNIIEGAAPLDSSYQPMGQSFTPTLSSVGFIMFNLYDGNIASNPGGTVVVNLRSTSITGTILSSSTGVFIPPGFSGIANFLFSIPVAVTPGTTYYIQPVIQSGNPGIGSFVTGAGYSGGTEILSGKPITDRNLWFREGIVVPEPSAAWLALLGGGVLGWRCRKR